MDIKKTILVTGGTGLVGNALQRLSSNDKTYNWVFIGKLCDLSGDYFCVQNLFKLYHPTYVIHLAAKVGGLYRNERAKLEMFHDNMKINENILRACEEFGVAKVILCLSTCVYPDVIDYPFSEQDLHQGPPHRSNEGYAYAKRMLEVQARLYNERREKNGCVGPQMFCVIPTNIYGPHDNFNLEDSHVIPGLIHRCYLAVRDGTPFVVRGSGVAIRQFIHADDVAGCIVKVLFTSGEQQQSIAAIAKNGVILSPSSDTEIPICEIVNTVADSFGLSRDRITYDTSFSDGQLRKTASNQLLMTCFPDLQLKPLNQGIHETVQWFITNYDKARK